MSWSYVWLATGGFLLILALLAFAYLVARGQPVRARRLLRSSAYRQIDRFLSNHAPRLWTFIRRRFTLGEWHGLALTVVTTAGFAAVYLFALIAESWIEQEALYAFDQRIYGWLTSAADSSVVTYMQIITNFGDGWAIAAISAVTGLMLVVYRNRWQVISLVLAVGVGSALMHGLKWIFERSRPTEQVIQVVGHSFPSGHAFMATTLYGWLIYLTWRFGRGDLLRIGLTVVLALLIFLIGMSRVILRVHWTSDVAGGFTVGFAWLACSLILTRVLRSHYSHRHPTPSHDDGSE